MPPLGRMKVTLDLSEYTQLPSDVRVRFDGWLKAETLHDKWIVNLTLAEGGVIVERYATDENGKVRVGDDGESIVMETVHYPVKTLPPAEAFNA